MGKKKLNEDCFGDLNYFSGVLPSHHNEVGCHNVSQQRRRIICEMKNLLQNLECMPKCNEWDTSASTKDTNGPYKFGVFQQRNGKPWDLHRQKSRELIGGQMTMSCACLKKNGLQDDCKMSECRGKDWCLTEPWPSCPPFTKEQKQWVEPNPLEMCPNVREGKVTAGPGWNGPLVKPDGSPGVGGPDGGRMVCYAPETFFVGNNGCCYKLEQISNPCCPQMAGTYSMEPC
ncbi:uncharacterized protein LOC106665692 [Cimex lectularius]|uniref:Uncharacterized protein n=1 Tax=Cimex lectularius TaxID=79782 RepID=A0A8I6RMQ2_CIMLE|nr:uncharacterized protein LOC106665692 [Cimex lectularius]XP_014247805.1 uncharacterized protein LOC106665692 [Cimex lectularius]